MSEFFCPSVVPENPDTLILQFYENLATVCPAPASRHTARKTFIYKDLKVASHVFLRTDSLRSSLQPPYTGPYQVISRTEKTYKLRINGKIVVVSVDRLKPAYMVSDMETCHQEPPPGSVPLVSNTPVQPALNMPMQPQPDNGSGTDYNAGPAATYYSGPTTTCKVTSAATQAATI
jgi:hypothetical protein